MQKRVTAPIRELPPRNEQFLLDFQQLQGQFQVSIIFVLSMAVKKSPNFEILNFSFISGPRSTSFDDRISPYILCRAV